MHGFQSTPAISVHPPATPPEVTTLHEQGSGASNEDALLCQGTLHAVFDGASSLCKRTYDGQSGAWRAANTAREVMLRHARNEEALAPLGTMTLQANDAIRDAMQTYGVATENPLHLWSTSMAAVRLIGDRLEYAQIGDSLILCITKQGFFLPAPYVNHDQATLCAWKDASDRGVPDVRAALHETICDVRREMNRTYGVLNGMPEAVRFLKTGTVDLAGVEQVVLFTDGLQVPSASPEQEHDFSPAVRALRRGGIHELHAMVRKMEKDDPHCRRYPRFKQHDDIAAIQISL